MAIIGATTMDSGFFQSLGIADKIWNNGPLNTQIQWFKQLMPFICGSTQGTPPPLNPLSVNAWSTLPAAIN